MSITVYRNVWGGSRARGSARLVLLAIADHADDGGQAWPSVARLARMTGLSRRQVQRRVRQLVKAGELVIEQLGGGGRSTRYRIAVQPASPETSPRRRRRHSSPDVDDAGAVSCASPETAVEPRIKPSLQPGTAEMRYMTDVAAAREQNATRGPTLGQQLRKFKRRRIPDTELRPSIALLRDAGFGDADAAGLARALPFADLRRALEMLRATKKPINNRAGWVRRCVEERWWEAGDT